MSTRQSPFMAKQVLDGVERWAYECYVLRETHALSSESRFDALMFPSSFHATCPLARDRGLYGVEVKVSRADFLRGYRECQFERYAKLVNGLYIATGREVCKTSEIPPEFGHLVVYRGGDSHWVAVCKRRAKFRAADIPSNLMWSVVMDLMDQCRRKMDDERKVFEKTKARLCEHLGDTVMKIAANIEQQTREPKEPKPC